ncbi:PREDICTED: G-type lectin S-receptor-like serine/threonine-protein kinase At2g19130 [Prunus mume]|uniref:G-type lectin S-receptor-like serine/threonine-protein kinase At2g19130 n=1 Tax=Prunus mume TaxID=102107 RepID=A0ABM1LNM8_PRUMU|nr:PREDICTED: G-type lectin S-receptor-like serine/threonine-protein kinase At2g19130 [Prunus mume]
MDAKPKQRLVLFLCLCLHLKTHVCLAADTIAANQSLSGDQTIVSAEKVFELGFFKPGQIQQLSWLENSGKWNFFWSKPGKRCDVYDLCGAFGSCNEVSPVSCNCLTGFEPKLQRDWNLQAYSGGCKRKTPLHCENATRADGKQDQFLKKPGMSLPENEQSVKVETIAGCESICLNNCSCTAYAYNSSGCSIWIGDLFNLQELTSSDSRGITLYLRLAASEFKSPKSNKGLIIGVVAGSAAGIAVLLGLIVVVILRQRKRVTGMGKAVEGSLVAFGYRDLQDATKNFSEKLGGGGFGSVFKGTLPDSSVIAVKKLESVSQGEKQFRTEVSTIGTIQHVNLVRLRGLCSEGTKRMLVYDYMPNGSLDSHLFHDKRPNVLDWKTRYQIALGTARGLAYLHEKCRDCIIHCDIKPENILLDTELGPKVADFGLAKLVGREFSSVLTTMRVGIQNSNNCSKMSNHGSDEVSSDSFLEDLQFRALPDPRPRHPPTLSKNPEDGGGLNPVPGP